MTIEITAITDLPADLDTLLIESENEGYRFVRTLCSEWSNGVNRFNNTGEFLLIATDSTPRVVQTLAICGINIDPYLDPTNIARLRHLYCLPAYRGNGIGSALVRHTIASLDHSFSRIRLRVPDARTGGFYLSLGFKEVDEPAATHSLRLTARET